MGSGGPYAKLKSIQIAPPHVLHEPFLQMANACGHLTQCACRGEVILYNLRNKTQEPACALVFEFWGLQLVGSEDAGTMMVVLAFFASVVLAAANQLLPHGILFLLLHPWVNTQSIGQPSAHRILPVLPPSDCQVSDRSTLQDGIERTPESEP